MVRVFLREARADDAEFLTDMLIESFNWTGEPHLDRSQVMGNPDVAHYVEGWPRPGDVGVVALDDDGKRIGAAWVRLLSAADPGYGYIDDETPEITVAMDRAHRGKGLGRALVEALLDAAADHAYRRVSLSVEDGNPAAALLHDLGFEEVGSTDGSTTMVRALPRV